MAAAAMPDRPWPLFAACQERGRPPGDARQTIPSFRSARFSVSWIGIDDAKRLQHRKPHAAVLRVDGLSVPRRRRGASFSMTARRNRGCRAKPPGPQKKNQRVSRPNVKLPAACDGSFPSPAPALINLVLWESSKSLTKVRFLAGIDGHAQTSRGSMGTVEPATAFFNTADEHRA